MALRPETVERITAMWHRPSLWPTTLSVMTFGSATFIVAPEWLQERAATVEPTADAVRREFEHEIEKPIGTVRLAYADESVARLAPISGIVRIEDDDARQRDMEARADRDEWREASADETSDTRYALLENDAVVAIATLGIWDETVGSIGVFTDVQARGRGLAGRVASAAVAEILRRGFVAQWQSLVDNLASARVADKLDFETLGRRTVFRVRQPSP